MSITNLTLTALSSALQKGEISAREAVQASLERIRERDGEIGAFISLNEQALQAASDRDAADRALPLFGVPVALKDNLCVRNGRTTCASRMLENYVSPFSCTAWRRLEQAGCILLGKTNLDEFAMGSDTTSSALGITRNPHDLTCVPGGSSGGSAAAVAAGETPLALGSDTGGSIRQPAAFCGVVGMKPTYGLVSRYGLVAFASSLDTVGPMTRTVEDNALALGVLAGHDSRDSTSVGRPADYMAQLGQEVRGLRIGLPRQMMNGLQAEVRAALLHAAHGLEALGAAVEEVDLPSLEHALAAYYIISSAEASSNLARFDGVRYGRRAADCATLEEMYVRSRSEGFGPEVKRRILLGTHVLSAGYWDAYYKKALQVRTLVIGDFAKVFQRVDCLLAPVSPVTAWKIGEKASPLERYQADVHTVPASIAGIPALAVPAGKDAKGLPIGLQLMGPAFSEPLLYRVGHVLEKEVR